MMKPGFFQLQSPLNLLNKMEFDYTMRMQKNPFDVYAAFDFFVAAEHLPEWLSKARFSPGEEREEPGRSLRAICKELANGAKHFTPYGQSAVRHAGGSAGGGIWGLLFYGPFAYGGLILELGKVEATALGREHISAVELAGMVLSYWKSHPAVERCARLEQEREGRQL